MSTERTSQGKFVIFSRATGKRFERFPVDAREMLASGDYTSNASECSSPAEAPPVVEAKPEAPKVPTEHSPGIPLVVTKSADAPPGKPSVPQRSRGKK